ncbi:hypothetical protein TYRP_013866 [Tyrophagus putrescentiae]|nr:hypothetical protein TYRP_013866 [Tyrophagus putrescentiae]
MNFQRTFSTLWSRDRGALKIMSVMTKQSGKYEAPASPALGQTAEEKVVVVEGVVSADPLVPPARKLVLAKAGKVVVATAAFAAVPAFLRQVNDVKVSGVDGRHLRQVDHGQQRAAVVVVVAVVVVFHPPVTRYDGQSAKGGRLVRSERLGEQVVDLFAEEDFQFGQLVSSIVTTACAIFLLLTASPGIDHGGDRFVVTFHCELVQLQTGDGLEFGADGSCWYLQAGNQFQVTGGGINGRKGRDAAGLSSVLKEHLLASHLFLRHNRSIIVLLEHVVAKESEVLHRGATVLEVGIVEELADEGLIAQNFRQWKALKDQAEDVHGKVGDGGGGRGGHTDQLYIKTIKDS